MDVDDDRLCPWVAKLRSITDEQHRRRRKGAAAQRVTERVGDRGLGQPKLLVGFLQTARDGFFLVGGEDRNRILGEPDRAAPHVPTTPFGRACCSRDVQPTIVTRVDAAPLVVLAADWNPNKVIGHD